MIPELTSEEIERFHSKVLRSDGCWPWAGEKNNKGYGRFTIYRGKRRVRLLAHRVAFSLATGMDPGELILRHRCDNPPCCNPADLVTGTQADNMRDAAMRGRLSLKGLTEFRSQRAEALERRIKAGEKWCPRCRLTLPASAFQANTATVDGLQSYCRECSAAYKRQRSVRQGGTTERERRMILRERARAATAEPAGEAA